MGGESVRIKDRHVGRKDGGGKLKELEGEEKETGNCEKVKNEDGREMKG